MGLLAESLVWFDAAIGQDRQHLFLTEACYVYEVNRAVRRRGSIAFIACHGVLDGGVVGKRRGRLRGVDACAAFPIGTQSPSLTSSLRGGLPLGLSYISE